MFVISKRALVILGFMFSLCISHAKCNFDSTIFEGKLVPSMNEDGFPVSLGTTELSRILVSCEGLPVTIKIETPVRIKNGGPELSGPFTSYFTYLDKKYTNKQQLVIDDAFTERTIAVGMTLQNKGQILPAADNYRYTVQLSITALEEE